MENNQTTNVPQQDVVLRNFVKEGTHLDATVKLVEKDSDAEFLKELLTLEDAEDLFTEYGGRANVKAALEEWDILKGSTTKFKVKVDPSSDLSEGVETALYTFTGLYIGTVTFGKGYVNKGAVRVPLDCTLYEGRKFKGQYFPKLGFGKVSPVNNKKKQSK